MGEELKESKLYFRMANEEKNDWQELKETVKELKTEQETILKSVENAEYSFDFNMTKEQIKQWKKVTEIAPLSKKRTQKLLMAHGFDRDTAQMYADTMKPRNVNAIKELIKLAGNYEI